MEENKQVNGTNVTNFLIKLWSILEDESIADVVCWDMSGKSFHIFDLYKFCEVVLPRFFKSKHMSSFVRQLNLYGFKKIAAVERVALSCDNLSNHMQFYHPLFRRGQPQLLNQIKRNSKRQTVIGTSSNANDDLTTMNSDTRLVTLPENDLISMIEELESLRSSHSRMQSTIYELTRDNELLWNEVSLLRDQHVNQQQNVAKLVQFLISLMQPATAPVQKHCGSRSIKRSLVRPNELTLASQQPQQQNWDTLSCIQEELLAQTIHYSTASALSPPPAQEMPGPSTNTSLNFKHTQMPKQLHLSRGSIAQQQQQLIKQQQQQKMQLVSPRQQLSMHLSSPRRSAVVPFSFDTQTTMDLPYSTMDVLRSLSQSSLGCGPSGSKELDLSHNESIDIGAGCSSLALATNTSQRGGTPQDPHQSTSHLYDIQSIDTLNEAVEECLGDVHDYNPGEFEMCEMEEYDMLGDGTTNLQKQQPGDDYETNYATSQLIGKDLMLIDDAMAGLDTWSNTQ